MEDYSSDQDSDYCEDQVKSEQMMQKLSSSNNAMIFYQLNMQKYPYPRHLHYSTDIRNLHKLDPSYYLIPQTDRHKFSNNYQQELINRQYIGIGRMLMDHKSGKFMDKSPAHQYLFDLEDQLYKLDRQLVEINYILSHFDDKARLLRFKLYSMISQSVKLELQSQEGCEEQQVNEEEVDDKIRLKIQFIKDNLQEYKQQFVEKNKKNKCFMQQQAYDQKYYDRKQYEQHLLDQYNIVKQFFNFYYENDCYYQQQEKEELEKDQQKISQIKQRLIGLNTIGVIQIDEDNQQQIQILDKYMKGDMSLPPPIELIIYEDRRLELLSYQTVFELLSKTYQEIFLTIVQENDKKQTFNQKASYLVQLSQDDYQKLLDSKVELESNDQNVNEDKKMVDSKMNNSLIDKKEKKMVYVNDDIYLLMRYVFNIYERLQYLQQTGLLDKSLKVNDKKITVLNLIQDLMLNYSSKNVVKQYQYDLIVQKLFSDQIQWMMNMNFIFKQIQNILFKISSSQQTGYGVYQDMKMYLNNRDKIDEEVYMNQIVHSILDAQPQKESNDYEFIFRIEYVDSIQVLTIMQCERESDQDSNIIGSEEEDDEDDEEDEDDDEDEDEQDNEGIIGLIDETDSIQKTRIIKNNSVILVSDDDPDIHKKVKLDPI